MTKTKSKSKAMNGIVLAGVCGVSFGIGALAGFLAAVALIEDDADAKRAMGFSG